MGEEWRKGWHPEKVEPGRSEATVLIVGAGPAGLEAARALGARGYQVMLAEASRTLGGRVAREATLPGMSEYIRVRDYREQHLNTMPNVEIFRESPLRPDDIHAVAADHVVIATGARWRRDLFDGKAYRPVTTPDAAQALFTPDDILGGAIPEGPVLLFDADGYYMAVAIAERLLSAGVPLTFATAADSLADWAGNTSERWRMRSRLMALGAEIVTSHGLKTFDGETVTLSCAYTDQSRPVSARSLVLVGQRAPEDGLFHALTTAPEGPPPFTVTRIGDCEAPGIVAQAVYSGHRFARGLDATENADDPLRHERVDLGPKPGPSESATETAPENATDSAADTAPDPHQTYLDTLLLYYEEEIMGDAYFRALAERFEAPDRRTKMTLMADVEQHAARLVRPVVEKYGLTARATAELEALGRADAEAEHRDWDALIAHMHSYFPDYMDDFAGLEAMAPTGDLPALRLLTRHEVAAIDFLNREVAGEPESAVPLKDYLALGAAEVTA
ncbi:MAG: FAD-dependent oxidoreductase [Pseudomonadota bacterium]